MQKYFSKNKKEVFIVLAITIFAFIIRLVSLLHFGDFWVDELYSRYFALRHNDFEIIKTLYNEDFHVPLYFIILNKWSYLFGENPIILRLMGCLITVFTIPVSFYVVKDLFNNRIIAYFVSLFVAVSAFNIHYSVELRFYGMSILLGLLSTYYFVKMLIYRKHFIAYSVSSILLLYTYNFSFMYVFCQFLVGAIYLFKSEKGLVKKYFKLYGIIAIIYLPIILMIWHNVLTYSTSLLKFVRDIFAFDLSFIFTFLMTVYSSIYEQYTTNDILRNYYYLTHLFSLKILFGVALPIIFGFIGFFRVLKEHSEKYALFVSPALILFFIQLVLVLTHTLALTLRYTIITTTVLLIVSICGYSLFKNKKLAVYCLTIWFLCNFSALVSFNRYSVMNRNIIYTQNLYETVKNLHIKSDFKTFEQSDIVFVPRFSKLLDAYIPVMKIIDFDSYDALFLGNRPQDLEFIFGRDLNEKINRKMAKTYLYPYLVYDTPFELQTNLKQNYFDKMKKGERFIIITDEITTNLPEYRNMMKDINIYARSSIYYVLSAKILDDSIKSAAKYLKFKEKIQVSSMFDIYVFEK